MSINSTKLNNTINGSSTIKNRRISVPEKKLLNESSDAPYKKRISEKKIIEISREKKILIGGNGKQTKIKSEYEINNGLNNQIDVDKIYDINKSIEINIPIIKEKRKYFSGFDKLFLIEKLMR